LGEELKHAKQSEAALEEVGDEALSAAIKGVQEHLEEIRRQYKAHRTADLNRFISDDPSEIMVGLTDAKDRHTLGRDKLSGLALLAGVFYDSHGDEGDDKRKPKDTMVRPVLVGNDETLGTLPEGQAVRALFVQTSSMPVI
jgi:thioredoxin-like negative regulator of GroEL